MVGTQCECGFWWNLGFCLSDSRYKQNLVMLHTDTQDPLVISANLQNGMHVMMSIDDVTSHLPQKE